MLKVVDRETNLILWQMDAWYIGCVDSAKAFVKATGRQVLDTEITFMGDMIWWVA